MPWGVRCSRRGKQQASPLSYKWHAPPQHPRWDAGTGQWPLWHGEAPAAWCTAMVLKALGHLLAAALAALEVGGRAAHPADQELAD